MFHNYPGKTYIYMNIMLRKNDFLVKIETVTKRPTYRLGPSLLQSLQSGDFPIFRYFEPSAYHSHYLPSSTLSSTCICVLRNLTIFVQTFFYLSLF